MNPIATLLRDLARAGVRLSFVPTGFVYCCQGDVDERLLARIQEHSESLQELLRAQYLERN